MKNLEGIDQMSKRKPPKTPKKIKPRKIRTPKVKTPKVKDPSKKYRNF